MLLDSLTYKTICFMLCSLLWSCGSLKETYSTDIDQARRSRVAFTTLESQALDLSDVDYSSPQSVQFKLNLIERYLNHPILLDQSKGIKRKKDILTKMEAHLKTRQGRLDIMQYKTGIEWIKIPGGSFMMGEQRSDAYPLHQVEVPPFYISKTEVTVAQYTQCVKAGVCSRRNSKSTCRRRKTTKPKQALNCISWKQARTFAKWVGGDLPSEAEWGNTKVNGLYAVGSFTSGRCGNREACLPCSKPKGKSAQGVCDLSGNYAEWVLDEYDPMAYLNRDITPRPKCSQSDCQGDRYIRVNRGAHYNAFSFGRDSAALYRASRRSADSEPEEYFVTRGFRVIMRLDNPD